MLNGAISARRGQSRRAMASGCPVARSTANRIPEPAPRHKVRNVNGATSAIATFIAVQLHPQTSASPASTHHSLAGKCSP